MKKLGPIEIFRPVELRQRLTVLPDNRAPNCIGRYAVDNSVKSGVRVVSYQTVRILEVVLYRVRMTPSDRYLVIVSLEFRKVGSPPMVRVHTNPNRKAGQRSDPHYFMKIICSGIPSPIRSMLMRDDDHLSVSFPRSDGDPERSPTKIRHCANRNRRIAIQAVKTHSPIAG